MNKKPSTITMVEGFLFTRNPLRLTTSSTKNAMKNNLIFALTLITLFPSCSNDDHNQYPSTIASCDVENPIEDLTWLSNQVEEIKSDKYTASIYSYIEIAVFNDETVFIFNNCCPTCNTVIQIFNCDGIKLGNLYVEIQPAELTDSHIIFKRVDSPCNN